MDSNNSSVSDPQIHASSQSSSLFHQKIDSKDDDPFVYLSPTSMKNNGLRQVSNFSTASSNYSNQTHQSSASQASQASHQSSGSVIHNPSSTKENSATLLKMNVLDYIKSSGGSEFDPNDLFKQRQQQSFITSFDKKSRIPTKPTSSSDVASQSMNNENKLDDNELDDNKGFAGKHSNDDKDNGNDDEVDEADEALSPYFQSQPSPKKSGSIFFDDDYENDFDHEYDDDDDLDEDDDDLPSPPRSPPREIDPDKLYGLYDFSGPDPSHCSITRDEPVYLINDQDNYWWLIRKLSKEERIRLTKARLLNKSDGEIDQEDDDYLLTDEEDGKIGFVPAECLETHGERLARLNCFKNEELEKSSRDLLNSSNPSSSDNVNENIINKSVSSIGLGSPVNFQKSPDTTLSRSGSILKDGTKQSINKSVTFEDLGVLEMNEESEDEESEFPTHYNIPEIEEIHNEIHNERTKEDDDEKKSEILSDIYPTESPLIINKRKSTSDSPSPTKDSSFGRDSTDNGTIDHYSPNTPQSSYQTPVGTHPEVFNGNSDDDFKTPVEYPAKALPKKVNDEQKSEYTPQEDDFKTPQEDSYDYLYQDYTDEYYNDDDDELDEQSESFRNLTPRSKMLRRSEILNKLNQVTSDIQNELQDYDDDDYYDDDDDNYLSVIQGSHSKSGSFSSRSSTGKELDVVSIHSGEKHSPYEVGSGYGDEDDNNVEESFECDAKDMDVTPLTSVNSFRSSKTFDQPLVPSAANPNNRADANMSSSLLTLLNSSSSTPTADKRKSKPVHEMFVPILGKFDELAEKLAEIDEML